MLNRECAPGGDWPKERVEIIRSDEEVVINFECRTSTLDVEVVHDMVQTVELW